MTKNARQVPDGSRPAVLYTSAQHAREWITPEMTRRLMHYVLDGYAAATPRSARCWTSTELWFVPVANPDGYDYTFTTDRLWRKNLRDNDGDGQITGVRRRRPQPQLPDPVGLRQRGLVPLAGQRDLPRPRAGVRAGDAGPRRPAGAGSASSS